MFLSGLGVIPSGGILDKCHALSLSFYIIPSERHAHVYGTVQERASFFAVWTL